jgi:hypothetical protein
MRGLGLVDVAYTLDRFARAGTEPEYVLRVIDLRPAT